MHRLFGSAYMMTGLLVSLAACGSVAHISDGPATENSPQSFATLAAAAGSTGRLFGTAVAAGDLGNPTYTHIATSQFSIYTPENELKWGPVEPNPGQYNWGPADSIIGLARQNGIKVHGHTLVWHGQLPDYVNGGMSAGQLQDAMLEHIQGTVSHYRGQIESWDVVNEAVADDGGLVAGLKDTIFTEKLGPGFIATAFNAAHQADPGALLFYNDYGCEFNDAKTDRLINMLQSLVAQGVPINGVGLQSHFGPGHPSVSTLMAVMQRITALGLQVRISELDVAQDRFSGDATSQFQQQAQVYSDVASSCIQTAGCSAITIWQFSDPYSWLMSFLNDSNVQALPWDAQFNPKPAFYSLIAALAPPLVGVSSRTTATTAIQSADNAGYCFDIHGANAYNGAKLSVFTCNDTMAQQWQQVGNTLQILGKCLDDPAGMKQDGMFLQLWDCVGAANQQWVVDTTSHNIRLANSNMCITMPQGQFANAAPLQLFTCNGSPEQTWVLPGASASSTGPKIVSALNGGYCLDLANGSIANGSKLQLNTCSQSPSQQWSLKGTSLTLPGNFCLDDPADITNNGIFLQAWGCDGAANQTWTYDPAAQTIRLAGTQKCLDINEGIVGDHVQLQLWDCNGGANQKWQLR